MKFDLFDMVLVGVAATFGATTFLSPGGMIGAAVGSAAAILVAVIVKRIAART